MQNPIVERPEAVEAGTKRSEETRDQQGVQATDTDTTEGTRERPRRGEVVEAGRGLRGNMCPRRKQEVPFSASEALKDGAWRAFTSEVQVLGANAV